MHIGHILQECMAARKLALPVETGDDLMMNGKDYIVLSIQFASERLCFLDEQSLKLLACDACLRL